jgi:succinate dehydrogenase/fumarate reductase flavoprotein subunit
VYYDEEGATSLNGLYAAGDEFFGGISGAAVFGWIAGENAAKRAKGLGMPSIDHAKTQMESVRTNLEGIRNRKVGANWKEANIALQQIMYDFTGEVRSETLLEAGLLALKRLRNKVYEGLIAGNPHELCRCLEVFNLLEVGELIFKASNERKETRGKHIRTDYPFTNPQFAKLLVLKNKDGEPEMEWRPIKR